MLFVNDLNFVDFLFLFLVVCLKLESDGFGKLDADVVDGLEDVFVGVFEDEDVLGCDEHDWLEDV